MIDPHAADRSGSSSESARRIAARALDGRATLLLLTADDAADASAAFEDWAWTLRPRGPVLRCATGLAWERDRAGGVLARLGLDTGSPTLGLGAEPTIVAVTEAGDADAASLQALSSAVHRLGPAPVLVVLTASVRQTQDPVLGALVRAHRGSTIRVAGLDGAGVQRVASRLGRAIDDHAAKRLARHTEGSTAAVAELLERFDPDQWRPPDTPLPATHAATRQIADALDGHPAIRELVHACATIGRWCSVDDAAQVAGITTGAGDVLDEAVGAGVLVTRRAGMRVVVGFASRLLRAAAYEGMPVARQRDLHRRAGEVLSSPALRLAQRTLASAGADADLARDLEDFAVTCGEEGEWNRASRAWLAASRVSVTAQEARRRLTNCLDATVSDGYLYAARSIMAEVESAERRPEQDAAVGYYQMLLGHRDEAALLLEQAWDAAADAPAAVRSSIAHRLALHALVDWDGAALVRWGEKALELADGAVPSAPSGFEAHTMLGLGLGAQGRTPEAEDVYQRLTAAVGAGAQGQRALMGQGWLHLALGRTPLAAHELEVSAPMTVWRGSTRISLWALAWLAHARLALGDLAAAGGAVSRALLLLRDTGQAVAAPLVHWAAAQIAVLRGETDRAEQHAAAAASVRTDYQSMLVAATMARAVVLRGSGDHAGIVRAFEPLVRLDRHAGIDEPGFWPWHDTYATALIAVGELDAADAFLRTHEERAAARQHRSVMARLGAARGRLQFSRGDTDAGRDAFDRALALTTDLSMPLLRADIHLGYGQALRRLGKRRDAEAELQHARQDFVAMHAEGYVALCDRELKAGSRSRDSSSVTDLTPQEQAVADLVVRGMTNREVAENLFLSVKTVQYHLTRIYARLGIRSRSELTALWHSG